MPNQNICWSCYDLKALWLYLKLKQRQLELILLLKAFFLLSCRYWERHFRVPMQQKKYNFVVGCWNFVGTHCSYPKFTGSPHWSVVGCIFTLPSEIWHHFLPTTNHDAHLLQQQHIAAVSADRDEIEIKRPVFESFHLNGDPNCCQDSKEPLC